MSILRTPTQLPNKTDWFHVYQIGPVTPKLYNLFTHFYSWVRLDDQVNLNKNLVDLYTKRGRMIPRVRAFTLLTRDYNLIVAVIDDRTIADLNVEEVFLKVYSNAYFKLPENQTDTEGLKIVSRKLVNQNDSFTFQAQWREAKLRKGHAFAFVNGERVYDLNATTVKVGDYAEYVWDSSITHVVKLPVKDLPSFQSTLDSKGKFLLHYPATPDTVLDQHYQDDVDVYLIRYTSTNAFRGVYYNKNLDGALRNVTHRDYSVPSEFVAGYLVDNPSLFPTLQDVVIELFIRDQGVDQFLVHEHSRIEELYKLPEDRLVQAMLGTHSNLDFWKAAALEANYYLAIVRAKEGEITTEMVERAYGYNAISVLTADTPQLIDPGQRLVKLPAVLQVNATVYEYTVDGRLINWYYHAAGQYYPIRNVGQTRMVEAIVGRGGKFLKTHYGKQTVTLDTGFNYRFYTCPIFAGEVTNEWVEVTGTDAYSMDATGNVIWGVDPTQTYTAIKSDENFPAYTLKLDYLNQVLRFTVTVAEERTDGQTSDSPMLIPPAYIELWLNKRPLIMDLDFFVKWPEICIVNKEYLVDGLDQVIDIRCRGFCTPELKLEQVPDWGFIKHGMLSNNKQYDVRDDKVVRIVVDGSIKHRSSLSFAEDEVSLHMSGVRNGAPYQVTDPPISLKRICDQDSYLMRDVSKGRDKQVEDYLTLYRPDLPDLGPNPIPRKYDIYSPFVGRVIYDFMNGFLSDDDIQDQYSDTLVRSKLKSYEWLLDYEPTYRDMDFDYIAVHPHNRKVVLVLPARQYIFVQRAVKLYLDNIVDITKFLAIEPGFEHYTSDHPHPYRVLP